MGFAVIIPDVDFSDVNLGQVTITEQIPVKALSIDAPNSIIGTTYKLGVTYNPINTNQRGVIWSITNGNEYATVNESTGVLTILSGASSSSITVRVVSSSNPDVYATKDITVSRQGEPGVWQDITQDMVEKPHSIGNNGNIDYGGDPNTRQVAVIPIPYGASKYIFRVIGENRQTDSITSFINQEHLPQSYLRCTHYSIVDTTVIQSAYEINLQSGDVSVVVWQKVNDTIYGSGNIQFKFE